MSVKQDDNVSFVEKALSRLKGQQEKLVPLGEIRDNADGDDAAVVAIAAQDNVAPDRIIAVERQRLTDEGFLAPEKYQRQLADEYRLIKRPLIANAFGIGVPAVEDGNLILVSSAVSGEGKTHTCINLALSLAAERDRTVLLVDGDVAKPHISRLFGVADQPGLLDALDDDQIPLDKLLIHTDIPGLVLLPAGRWSDYTTELLASGRMRDLCKELSGRYSDRIILFDSPPILATTEAQAIAQAVGQIALVVAENTTPRDEVRAALSQLDPNKPINAILNKSRQPFIGGYYYGGYGYGRHADKRASGSDYKSDYGSKRRRD
ncbi:MAG: AAA family ATPase [Gammaproteobacteria bacterium]|nr:AAA family ATPase [Gammaproteobacteria bacterium]